jgi:DNA mismatch endonuclease (patch repair protein)
MPYRDLPAFAPPSDRVKRIMAAIRDRDTKPEIIVRRVLHRSGFRFRVRPRNVPGKPDLVLPRFRTVVMVNGCFWHRHTCRAGHAPKTNSQYWTAKIERNVARDECNRALLEAAGWHVVMIWECSLTADLERLIGDLRKRHMQKAEDIA